MSLYSGKYRRQGSFVSVLPVIVFILSGCSPRQMVTPPATPPLSRDILGYGVVTVSYTRVMNEPSMNGVSLGYVRAGTLLPVTERRLVMNGGNPEYWVFIQGDYSGWLREDVIELYENEGKARTAASEPGGE